MTLPMRCACSLLVLIVLLGAPLVGAQEASSRAEEEARRQAEKARTLSPPEPGLVERQLLAIEAAGGFGVARGLFVTIGDIKRGSSVALGPAYGRTFSSGGMFQAKAAYSTRQFKMAQLMVQGPPLARERLRVNARARWQDAPVGAVYPLGPDSPSRRADYGERKTEFSAQAAFNPVRAVRFNGGTGFELFRTGPGDSRRPSVETVLPNLPGLEADPTYVHSHVSAAVDSRQGLGFSRGGTLLRATLHDYRQVNDPQDVGPFSFRRVDGAAEQYVPILHVNWVLYFSLHASITSTDEGKVVPFFLMPDLGGSRSLRGFPSYRFRDRHALVATAEYRWYAQEFFEAAIFYDTGKVAPTRGDLDFSHLKSDVGIGFRLHTPGTTVLRLEVARSRERLRFIVSFSPVGGG